ncbi:uncharacterized protein LOC128490760 [Spea bombifrons]|uniref:uncharacterized protein LOC128490760 n=1 Tax=Spea bombifrons TaxID=233779 RepID=UPI00234B8D04|nr:uncharacterized protein LOC128490760 [Spea bombifrons]
MGVYASTFPKSGDTIILESTDPSQSNWITAHAETCKLSIPEVQRCWSRFLMLNPDTNGNVKRSCFLSNDVFNKKILDQIPSAKDDGVTFQTYCSAVSWLARAPQESKIRGLYQLLISNTSTKESLQMLLNNVYPDVSPETIDDLCKRLFPETDVINEDQFVSLVQAIPQAQVASVLSFSVIPPDLDASHEQSLPSIKTATALENKGRVQDDQLHHIAIEMTKRRRDWRLLANRLGFLEKDSRFFEQAYPGVKDQILKMLYEWRNAVREDFQSQTLQDALKHTANTDILNEVFTLGF